MKVDVTDLSTKARAYLSTTPRPFIKWAGSKRALLEILVGTLPPKFGTYWEPFLGSGALFFLLQPARARLNDNCPELIDAYLAVRRSAPSVLRYLHSMPVSKGHYYAVRDARARGEVKRAAEFIYLNRLCWNGLYRVNRDGEFNVPYGRPRTDFLVDKENLRACAQALGRPQVHLTFGDFEPALDGVKAGDLVYLDPPYVTSHNNNGFVEYNKSLFGWADQLRLARVAADLAALGAYVIVTNADHAAVRRLYPGFRDVVVGRASTLAADVDRRRQTTEVILASG